MKTIMKLSLISGLLTSGIVLADPHSDAYQKYASSGCHHGAGSRSEGQGMEGKKAFWDKMAERLQLTTEQRASIGAVMEKSRPQTAAIREKIRTNRRELRELARNAQIDDSRVQKLARERGNLVAELVTERTRTRHAINQILTDAQQEQMKQMREKNRHHGKG
jgi:Spy/CpxP family protein refolding chaperone